MIKKTLYTAMLLLWFAVTAAAKDVNPGAAVRISNFELVQDLDSIAITFDMQIGRKATKSRANLTVIPMLKKGNDSIELRPVVVRGKRAEILFERRYAASPSTMAELSLGDAIITKNGETVSYGITIPVQEWMTGAVFYLDGIYENCCSAIRTNLGKIEEELIIAEEELFEEELLVIQASPLSVGDKLAKAAPYVRNIAAFIPVGMDDGSMKVYFHLNKYDIDEDYRNNRKTIDEILAAVEAIEHSDESRVEKIVIAGYASPEGAKQLNDTLSMRRANTIRQIIIDNSDLTTDMIEIYGGGQDWGGLRKVVAESDIREKEQIIDIIDNVPVWDIKNGRGRLGVLMRLNNGEPYRYMLKNIFPDLRSVAYITIYYSNVDEEE